MEATGSGSVKVLCCQLPKPMTAAKAKELLGWREESENVKFGGDFLLRDKKGNKVLCYNNVGNRPYKHSRTLAYHQDILRRRWQFNGQPRVISKEGHILSGQHVLAALVLAAQEYNLHPGKWSAYWQQEPYIETLVVSGIESSEAVKNTIDCARESTLADVLYRTEHFADVKPKHREALGKVCQYGVRLLWKRVDQRRDAYSPIDTRSEQVDFLNRHPKLIDCTIHIFEQNGGAEQAIRKYIALGSAAGLMYLMGCARSNPHSYYHSSSEKSEENLDWSLWDKAESFWTLLASSSSEMKAVRDEHLRLLQDGRASSEVREALLVRAWLRYASGVEIRPRDLTLQFDSEKEFRLAVRPLCGGIDGGDQTESADDMPDAEPTAEPVPEPQTKPRVILTIPLHRLADPTPSPPTEPAKARGGRLRPRRAVEDHWSQGDVAWVEDGDGEPYLGVLIEEPYPTTTDGLHVVVAERGDDKRRWEVALDQLSLTRP